MSIRIVLAEDHVLMRQGLRTMLEKEPDMEVIAEASDGREAVEIIQNEKPDILLTDISMPNLNGADATRQIVRDFPDTRIIALSMHRDKMFVRDMLQAGASGYVLKDCLFDEVLKAIRSVHKGGTYLSPAVAGEVVEDYLSKSPPTSVSPIDSLTSREREVLQLVAEGKSTKQIAHALHVSTKAIEAHRRKIMDKLDAHSVAELVKAAILGGLTSIDG